MAAALLALIALVRARHRVAARLSSSWAVLDATRAARTIALAAVVWTAVAAVRYGTFVAGGSDSYGYVSQAFLLADGRVVDTVPTRPEFRWPDVDATLTPLAFVPLRAGVIAPMYPPGLPLLMAGAATFSTHAIFFVVPLLGVLTVWLCFRIGVQCGDPLAGALGAALLSVSPTFLFQLFQPMSDVPAAAFWLAALFFAARGTSPGAWLSGVSIALAILIRPNLAPLALPIALVAGASRGPFSIRRIAAVAVPAAAGVAALGWIQWLRFGSPIQSGYGDASGFLSLSSIVPNLQRYPRWLTETHTWFIWGWIAAPVVVRHGRDQRPVIRAAVAVVLMTIAAYLPYSYFQLHEWHYSRYLLPAIPLMLLLSAAVALVFIRRAPLAMRVPLTLVLAGGLAFSCVRAAVERDAFRLSGYERKYRTAGDYVKKELPADAFVLAGQHSGSVRLYGARPILRWDLLPADALDTALRALEDAGQTPFLVVEPFEYEEFRAKFGGTNQAGVARVRLVTLVDEVRVYSFD